MPWSPITILFFSSLVIDKCQRKKKKKKSIPSCPCSKGAMFSQMNKQNSRERWREKKKENFENNKLVRMLYARDWRTVWWCHAFVQLYNQIVLCFLFILIFFVFLSLLFFPTSASILVSYISMFGPLTNKGTQWYFCCSSHAPFWWNFFVYIFLFLRIHLFCLVYNALKRIIIICVSQFLYQFVMCSLAR